MEIKLGEISKFISEILERVVHVFLYYYNRVLLLLIQLFYSFGRYWKILE